MTNSALPSGLSHPRQSIRARLLVSLGGTLAITLVIIIISIFLQATNVEVNSWQARQIALTSIAEQQIRSVVTQAQQTITFVANAVDDVLIDRHLDELLTANTLLLEMAVVSERGDVIGYAGRSETGEFDSPNLAQTTWFQNARALALGTYLLTEVAFTEQNQPYLLLATWGSGDVLVATALDMSFLNALLDRVGYGETETAYLVEADGAIIAHSDTSGGSMMAIISASALLPHVENQAVIGKLSEAYHDETPNVQSYTNSQGIPVIGVSTVVAGTDWILLTEVSQAEVFANSRNMLLPLILFTVLFWGGAMISTAWLLNNRVFAPLSRLRNGQEAVAGGNLGYQVDVAYPDELGVFSQGFNKMVLDLRQRTLDRDHAEEALRDSEKRYRDLLENVSDVVYSVDLRGHFTYISPSATLLTGYPEIQLVGKHFTELVEPSWRNTLLDFYRAQFETSEPETTLTFPIVTAGGERRWVEQKVSLILDVNSAPIGYQSVVRDISERKRSEEKLTALYTVMAQPSLTIDEQLNLALKIGAEILQLNLGIISQIENDTYTILYGYSPNNLLNSGQTFEFEQTYCELTYAANDVVTIEHVGASPYRRHPCYKAFSLEAYLGTPLQVNNRRFGTLNFSSASPREAPFTNADRDFLSLMGRWVSMMLERKFALEELRTSEANLRSLLDNSPAIISATDREYRIKFVRVPGVEIPLLEPFVGQSFLNFVPEAFHERVQAALRQVFDEQRTVQYETISIDPRDGAEHWYVTNAAPIVEDGQVVSALLINDDITERKAAERQIQAQNEALVKANVELSIARRQAEAASKLKSQFLATMSHELRTPLNAVIGYAQLQLMGMVGEMTDEQLEFQERILVNAEHLLGLINELLDLSKIEAGRLDLISKPFDLRDCLEEIILQNTVLVENKGLLLDLHVHDQVPELLIGDRGRIKQVIINLLSNAIKFTDHGSVRVEVGLNGNDSWRVTVADTGAGIPPHQQETVFDEFRQADSGIDKGGTGLGLAIVRKLVLMMGGNIRLHSEVGVGSTFVMTLPLVTEIEPTAEAIEL